MKRKLKDLLLATIILVASLIATSAIAQDKVNSNWQAPKEADLVPNPLKGNEIATKAGKKLYQQQCTVCHGEIGKGDGIAGMALNPRPASFQSANVQEQTDGAIFWKLTNGRTPMAAYKDILTEEQRWQLVNYIRTLSK